MRKTEHIIYKAIRPLVMAFLALTAIFAPVEDASAGHYAGAELTYAHTGVRGKYVLPLRRARDCGGIDLIGEMPVHGYAPGCAPAHQTSLLDLHYSADISEVCPGQATEC